MRWRRRRGDRDDTSGAETRVGSFCARFAVNLGGGVALVPMGTDSVTELACADDEEIEGCVEGHFGSQWGGGQCIGF